MIHKTHKEPHGYILRHLIQDNRNRVHLFKTIPTKQQGFYLLKLPKALRKKIISSLRKPEIVELLHYVDSDDATDLIQLLKKRRQKGIVEKLKKDLRSKVEFLLKFHPKTAAGMMSLDYIEVGPKQSFKSVARVIHRHEKRTGKFPAVLVVEKGSLIGELPGYVFGLHTQKDKITKYIRRIHLVKYNAPEKEVLKLFKGNSHHKIAVLDDDESIMGVIYADDIIQVMNEQSTDDLYDFAGVSDEEDALDPAWKKIKFRYKWLILNLFTAFLAACVISLFQETISSWILLAAYMPVIAGMGGNAGTQTLAVTVRGIALKEIQLKTGNKVIINEMIAGAVNGIIIGAIVALFAIIFNHSAMLGLIVGVSMIINLIIAGFFGTIIPLILKDLGKDPATSATIFITTATDVLGFLVFLGLASMVV